MDIHYKKPSSFNPFDEGHLRVIVASSLGTIFEWYDFYLYGSLADVVAEHFFTTLPSGSAFVMALLTFAAGFAVRPFGSIVFGTLGDRVGRKYTFLITIVVMGIATFLVGLLPTYSSIGIAAPIILVILRCIQGFAVGGEYGGAATYVAEHAPKGRRGFYTSFIQATADIGLLIALLIIIITRTIIGETAFKAWGWRIPYLLSVILLGISLFIRLKLQESPIFQEMKSEGKQAKSPLKESFLKWKNLRMILLVLFGAVGGQAVVGYASGFYVFYFLTQTLKVNPVTANILQATTSIFSIICYIIFGWLSDKIGRKPLIMAGCLLGALTYYPLFMALTHFANPQLESAMNKVSVVVEADPADCAFQFVPSDLKGHVKFTSSCDVLKNFLHDHGVSYTNLAAMPGTLPKVHVGDVVIESGYLKNLTEEGAKIAQENFTSSVEQAISSAGYPLKANPDQINIPMLQVMWLILIVYSPMAYGPMAAWLVELFPTKVRYTSISLPYHIGNGWIGGFLPSIAFAIVLSNGNIYSGLWYPIAISLMTFVIGMLFLRETKDVDLSDDKTLERNLKEHYFAPNSCFNRSMKKYTVNSL